MPHSKYDSPDNDPDDAHVFNPFFTNDTRHGFNRQPLENRQHVIRRLKTRATVDTHQEPPPSPTRTLLDHDSNALGLDIPRPRSALHRGDFREDDDSQNTIATSPVVPWHTQSQLLPRPRAASQASLSGSFSYQPPTSPLVHQANANDMPDHDSPHFTPTRNPHVSLHRHSSLRAFPYQAHQPRRSIGSISSLTMSPYPSARRPSISDASPLQHAPMVGSYEESILRGRMSTTPSKPLDFVAQIGVLGKGDCKPSLKCPPHLSIPFPAVFYSYASGTTTDPEPSPYVGMLDLENTLKKADDPETAAPRRRRRHHHDQDHNKTISHSSTEINNLDHDKMHRRQHKLQKRTNTAAPVGSYRIPEVGQLQIVIKNPNKTAVKLFLVPYDLSDMPPGTKTFIRQRSYSAGPIIDQPISNLSRFPDVSITDKPILRYLIHLNICSTQKGRYYLYGGVRVVFANRVPDGKEKLRTEMQMPEPRYVAWKPATATTDIIDVATKAKEDAKRRRSAVFPSHASSFDMFPQPSSGSVDSTTSFQHFSFGPQHEHLPTLESRPQSRGAMDVDSEAFNTVHSIARAREERGEEAFIFGRRDGNVDVKTRQESLLSRKLRDLEVRGHK
ncbi:unnamed protein product [Aureobasidium uvarum]|uniref:Atos-like conserved domain-containing protein n=1 Tax=Aureobasidium uvarum TaxID=2773716 RepID=A0A9N8KKJ2_9PEZI|nr:unnamed protein product [Aureobasidium uvarum]